MAHTMKTLTRILLLSLLALAFPALPQTPSSARLLASFAGQIPLAPIYGTDSGAANAYVVSAPSTFSLVTGALLRFTALHANTGVSIVNVGGSGSVSIVGQTGAALSGGEVPSTGPTWVQYTGSAWQIVGTGATPDRVRTAAEIAASVTPVNYSFTPGAFRRYGADPRGISDSSTAIANDIAANAEVFDDVTGGGTYLINATVPLISQTRIQGAVKQSINSTGGRGTTFILASAAGSNAAMFHATAFIEDLRFQDITITWQTFSTGQIGFLFDVDCRSARWENDAFYGLAVSGTNVTGIKFTGGGTFTGDVTIEKNYFTQLLVGVSLNGSDSTVRVLSNEMYSNPVIANSYGIYDNSADGGLVVAFNTFEGWNKAIFTANGSIRQSTNYFEGQTTLDFDWGTTTNNVSISDYSTGTGLANFRYDNTSGNVVFGGSYGELLDSNAFSAFRGFTEQGRSAANGHWSAITYASGNFAGPWAPTTGQVSLEQYSIVGNICTLDLIVAGATISGTGPAVTYHMPVTASQTQNFPVWLSTGAGTNQFGVARTTANSATLAIYVDPTFTTNWPTGASGGVNFGVSFQINSAVP